MSRGNFYRTRHCFKSLKGNAPTLYDTWLFLRNFEVNILTLHTQLICHKYYDYRDTWLTFNAACHFSFAVGLCLSQLKEVSRRPNAIAASAAMLRLALKSSTVRRPSAANAFPSQVVIPHLNIWHITSDQDSREIKCWSFVIRKNNNRGSALSLNCKMSWPKPNKLSMTPTAINHLGRLIGKIQ